MAKLVLITEKQYRPGINEVGDIIGAFPDDWKFTPTEIADFEIIDVDGDKSTVEMLTPSQNRVYKAKTTEWTDVPPDEKHLWKDKIGNWNEVVKNPKYKLRYEDKTIKENFSRYEENLVKIVTETELAARR